MSLRFDEEDGGVRRPTYCFLTVEAFDVVTGLVAALRRVVRLGIALELEDSFSDGVCGYVC